MINAREGDQKKHDPLVAREAQQRLGQLRRYTAPALYQRLKSRHNLLHSPAHRFGERHTEKNIGHEDESEPDNNVNTRPGLDLEPGVRESPGRGFECVMS